MLGILVLTSRQEDAIFINFNLCLICFRQDWKLIINESKLTCKYHYIYCLIKKIYNRFIWPNKRNGGWIHHHTSQISIVASCVRSRNVRTLDYLVALWCERGQIFFEHNKYLDVTNIFFFVEKNLNHIEINSMWPGWVYRLKNNSDDW